MGHGETPGPPGEVCHVTCNNSTKFHSNPPTPSRGFPCPPSTPAVFLGLFRRGSQKKLLGPDGLGLGSAPLGDFPAVFFRRAARANGEREKREIWQEDASCHVLTPCQVSSQSVHSFYRLPGPYLLSTGFPRGRPRNPAISPLCLGDFPAAFFRWTVRANGEREKAAIQVPDPSGPELQLHQVS